MKKNLTFLILLACAAGQMKAETVLFSADVTANDAVEFAASSTTEISNADATITGGTMYAINQQEQVKNLIAKQGGSFAFSITNNNTFFKVVLNQELKVGDVINARTYTRTDTELGIWLSTSDTRPGSCNAALTCEEATTASWADLTHIAESAKATFLKIYKFGVFRGVFAPFHPLKKLKKLKIRLRHEKVCDVVHPPVCRIEELALPLWPCTSPRRRNTSNSRTAA